MKFDDIDLKDPKVMKQLKDSLIDEAMAENDFPPGMSDDMKRAVLSAIVDTITDTSDRDRMSAEKSEVILDTALDFIAVAQEFHERLKSVYLNEQIVDLTLGFYETMGNIIGNK